MATGYSWLASGPASKSQVQTADPPLCFPHQGTVAVQKAVSGGYRRPCLRKKKTTTNTHSASALYSCCVTEVMATPWWLRIAAALGT